MKHLRYLAAAFTILLISSSYHLSQGTYFAHDLFPKSLADSINVRLLADPSDSAYSAAFSGVFVPQQDEIERLLAQWAKDGSADEAVVDRLMRELNIMSKDGESDLIAKLRAAGTKYTAGPSAFESVVRETLDKRRYAQVDNAVQEVLNAYGKDLEAVIRTGSSGKRYLQIRGTGDGGTGYRMFFSDDDISFVGTKAEEAARMLNGILENQGLAKLKVKGMDLGSLKNIRGIDLTAIELLEPDKFLGESGIASIKGEMLDKGAVIAERSGESMAMTARPLRQFVEAKKSKMLADLMDDSAVRATVQKFGALTVVGSCERQIVQTHAGWANLPDSEKVKYVLRQRFALSESGAMRNVAGEAASVTAADIAKLTKLRSELKLRPNLTAEELSWLNTLRAQNIDLAFKEIPQKLAPVIAVAEVSGKSVASNPEVRRMMNELTTGFALMRDRVIDIPETEMIAKLKSMAGENKELYSALYTSFQQSKDLVEALDQWIASGGTREAFIDMLVKAEGRLARLQQVIARRAKKANTAEAKTLATIEEMLGNDLGDNFFMKMAKNPAAKKVVLAAMVAGGGAACLKAMYESWAKGNFQEDLSSAAFGIMDFVPGGAEVKLLFTEGMDKTVLVLFIKDALYLSPAWPIALVGDVLVLSIDLGAAYKIQMQQQGLVDFLVYNSDFDTTGERPKFVRLNLPGGTLVEREALAKFFFEAKSLRYRHTGKEFLMNDLSAVSTDLLDKAFIPEDPVTQQLRQAAEQQMNAINRSEALAADGIFASSVGYSRWLFGFETVCEKSQERWCKVFSLLKKKITDRREIVKDKVMIAQLIEMAETKRATLAAANETEAKLDKLQEKLEQLRGKPLEVKLSAVVKKGAEEAGNSVRSDTQEERDMKRGAVWSEAYAAYMRIWNWQRSVKTNIALKTGWDRVLVLQFKWTGDPVEDERKSEQSRKGFASALARITRDITIAKGSEPLVGDPVDKEAFGILGDVVFPWRAALDESDKETAEQGSAYFTEYTSAVEKVKKLYAVSAAFQAQLDKGAQIVKGSETLTLDRSTSLELKFSDPELTTQMTEGKLTIRWFTSGNGRFTPDDRNLKTNYAPYSPEPVKLTVVLTRGGTDRAKGSLAVTMSVAVPNDFLILELTPPQPKPQAIAGITANIPERFFGGKPRFHYNWACTNCKVDNFDRSRTAVTAPKSGASTVTCELLVEGADGKSTLLLRKELKFDVEGKATPTPTPSPSPGATPTPTPTPSPSPTPGTTPTPEATPETVMARVTNRSSRAINVWAEGRSPKTMMDVLESHTEPGTTSGIKAVIPVSGSLHFYKGSVGAVTGGTNEIETSCLWKREPGVSGQVPNITYEADGSLVCGTTILASRVKFVPATVTPLKVGETTTVEAVVDALKPHEKPLTYSWSGTFEGEPSELKSTSKVTIRGNKIGKYKLSVSVAGKTGSLGKASLEYEVGGVTATLEKVNGPLLYGAEIPLTAKVAGMDKLGAAFGRGCVSKPGAICIPDPVNEGDSSSIKVIWQSEPAITFLPPTTGGPTTNARFDRMGKIKVWAEIMVTEEGRTRTVTETPQQEIEVKAPKYIFTFTPAEGEGKAGQEIRAVITEDPPRKPAIDPSMIDFVWTDPPSSNRMEYKDNASEIGFTLKDAKPVQLNVRARVPHWGDTIAEITGTYSPTMFTVKTEVLGSGGLKPQIWREGVGLVTVEKNVYCADEMVRVKATIVEPGAPSDIRWNWTANEGTTIGNNIAQEITVSRHETGTAELTVEAKDKNGVLLGKGTASFSVTVSALDIKTAKTKAAAANSGAAKKKEAADKLIKAKDLVRKGLLDEGITLVGEAEAGDPTNREAKSLSAKWKKERTAVQAAITKAKALLTQNKFVDASTALNAAKALHPLYKPVTDLDKEINDKWGRHDAEVKEAIGAVRLANEARDFKKALVLAPQVRTKFQLTAPSEAELKRYEDWAREHETEKERRRGILKQAEAKLNAGDFDGVLKDVDEMWKNFDVYWNFTTDPEPKIAENLKTQALARRDRINALLIQVKTAAEAVKFDKKQLQQGLVTADEILKIAPTHADAQKYRQIIADRLARGEKGAKGDSALAKGDSLQQSGDHKGAIKAYDSAIKADPNNAETYIKRGNSKLAIGDTKGALKDYDKGIELKSGVAAWHMARAKARESIGDNSGAISDYQSVVIIEPRNMDALKALAAIYVRTNNYQGLIDVYTKIINLEPRNAGAYLARGMAYQASGSCQLAIPDYEKAISLDPRNSPAYNGHGECREQGNDLKNALKDYEKAVQLDPGNSQAVANRDRLKAALAPKPKPTPTPKATPLPTPKPTPKPIPTPKSTPVTTKPKPTPTPQKTPKKPFEIPTEIKIPGVGTIKLPGAKPTPTPVPKQVPVKTPSGKETQVLNNGNIYGVSNGPTAETTFVVKGPWVLTYIQTYHWNNARGATPGSIGVYNDSGQRFGGWRANGTPGQGGVPNAYWEVRPNVVLPAGTYTIVVSSPETWSHNSQSGGRGFAVVKGYPYGGSATNTPPVKNTPNQTGGEMAVVAIIENRSNMPTHIFAQGDTFGPSNKIGAGEKRNVSVTMDASGRVKFTAGRNGQVITTKIWNGVAGDPNRYPRVIFDGSQLLITTGLR
ncbi:MAG: tetratricopeptide repeat protein [Acidobacteria bacterium]|nr:tetratricopeptide repeat protein [Acidobacteriota bacterium]